MVFQFVDDIGAPGKIADEDPALVSDRLRRNVLVRRGVPEDRADVHTALMREGAAADKGLIIAERPVGDIGDECAEGGQILEFLATDG